MSLCVADLTCGFCMQNSDFWTRIASLYGSQSSPEILCMQNSVPSIRNISPYGSQPLSVALGFKTPSFRPEQQVSMVLRYHLSFCAIKTE